MTDVLDEQRVTDTLLPEGRMSAGDLVREALRAFDHRAGRPGVTFAVVAAAVAAVVIALGLVRSAGDEMLASVDDLTPTVVVLTADPEPRPGADGLPLDAAARVRPIPGVVAAGTLTRLDVDGIVEIRTSLGTPVDDVDALGASPGLFDVAEATVRAGRLFDEGHRERADTVAVLGSEAASAFDLIVLDGEPTILVGGVRHTVIGLLEPVDDLPLLDTAVIVPETTAAETLEATVPAQLLIRVAVGEAERVAREALVAVDSAADDVTVTVPRDRTDVRNDVADDIDDLSLWLGVALASLGVVAVAVTTAAGLRTRRRELGLRRAYGARRGALVGQVCVESIIVGLVGALAGTAVGLVVVLGLASVADWSATFEPLWVVVTAVGALVVAVAVSAVGAAINVRGEPGRLLEHG